MLGSTPEDWKVINVYIIFFKRGGARGDPGDYKPVRLTCILGKLLESGDRESIIKYIAEQSLLGAGNQHGLCKGSIAF